jgi:hypothetical protein
MSKLYGPTLLVQQIIERVTPNVGGMTTWMMSDDRHGETPIERLLYAAIHLFVAHCEDEYFTHVRLVSAEAFNSWKDNESIDLQHLYITSQDNVAGWRADFVVHVFADWSRTENPGQKGWNRLIVECDGHDFHERTKEQAARDRDRDRQAQLAGIEIFRFTGSEIWRDPLGCATQVLAWANRRV